MRAALVLAVALLGSCAAPQPLTEILVVADTDLDVPSELASVHFRVVGPSGEEKEATADFVEGDPPPAVLALVHRGGPLGPFTVDAIAERASGEVIVERIARVSFVEGQVLVLPMHMLARCMGVSCGADETCAEDGCRPREIAPLELQTWSGAPPRLEPVDAAMPDAGTDAGPVCVVDADCDDGVSCTNDACVGGACAITPDAGLCRADAHPCTIETCDPLRGCVPVLEHALCDDAVACTVDRCDAADGCVSTEADSRCDDGVICTMDRCDSLLGCVSTPSDVVCDDGIACTTERCDVVDDCVYVADDAACDDGIGCTVDACDLTTGCSSTITPASCPLGERCDTSVRACVPGPTFTEVYAFLSRGCVGACHDAGADGGLDLSSRALAYASLVGVTAACGGGSNTRVIPYDARASLLWRKVSRVMLCGERMPPSGPPASSADAALLERWIAAGAPDN